MTLTEAIQKLEELDDNAFICAERPWTQKSRCEAVLPTEALGVPEETRRAGLEYFLEVHLAKQVLGVLRPSSILADKVRLLIYYAENDAYPDWAFD